MKKYNIMTLILVGLSFAIFSSCAKKSANIRAVKQVGSTVMNPKVSEPSIKAADAQGLMYDITSLAWPEEANGELKIEAELKIPGGNYIPFSTTHKNNSDSLGFIEDTANNTKIDIRARCSGENCEKYLLLATVVKGSYAVHQLAVVSYISDCKFNLQNTNHTVAVMYQSLDDLEQKSTATAKNDCLAQ